MKIESNKKEKIGDGLESLQTPRGIKKAMGTASEMEFHFTDACPRMHPFAEYWDTSVMPPVQHKASKVLVLDGRIDAQKSVTTLIFGGNYAKWFPEVDLSSAETVFSTWNAKYAAVDGLKFILKDGKLDAEYIPSASTTK